MVLLVKRVHVDSLFNCELIIGESRLVHQQQHVALTLDQTLRSVFFSLRRQTLCFSVVPVWVCHGVGLYGSLQRRAGVLGRLLSLRGARVQQRGRFVGVEGPAVVLGPRWTCWSVVRHPPEVLDRAFSSLVVVGTEIIRTSSFGVRMPVIVGSMAPVVPVVAVLVIRPFSRGVVVAVTA